MELKIKARKSQIWFTDFAIGLFIFILVLITYYGYTTNASKAGSGAVKDMLGASEAISSSLLLGGFPDNWTNVTAVKVGLTNGKQEINETKLSRLKDVNYTVAKRMLGSAYDFFMFFENSDGDIINIGTECGYGSSEVNVSKSFKLGAYYHQGSGDLMEDEIAALRQKLGIDIYENWASADAMLNNISEYDFVLMENPKFSSAQVADLEEYASSGGSKANPVKLFLSNEIRNNDGSILGVDYEKRTGGGQCSSQIATVINEDLFFSLHIGDTIDPVDCHYVTGEITTIAQFPDGKASIAKWQFGNGTIYYFSDFDVSYVGNLQDNVKEGLESSIVGCGASGNITFEIDYDDVVKTERHVIFKSKPAKMVLYLWQ